MANNLERRIERLEQRTPDEPDRTSPAGWLFTRWHALEYLGREVAWTEGERIAWIVYHESARQLFTDRHREALKREQLDLTEREMAAQDSLAANMLTGEPIPQEDVDVLYALHERLETLRATLDAATLAALDDYERLRQEFVTEAGAGDFFKAEARFFLALRRIIREGHQAEIAVLDVGDPLTLWSVGQWYGG
jgi:hypothetical protein